jgi:hypothetical protein
MSLAGRRASRGQVTRAVVWVLLLAGGILMVMPFV